MKNISLLLLLVLGVAVFFVGAVPHYSQPVVGKVIMTAGALLIFVFYLATLLQVIRSKSVSRRRRIVWIILILCAPIAGNLIYVIYHDAAISRQTHETSETK